MRRTPQDQMMVHGIVAAITEPDANGRLTAADVVMHFRMLGLPGPDPLEVRIVKAVRSLIREYKIPGVRDATKESLPVKLVEPPETWVKVYTRLENAAEERSRTYSGGRW